MKNKILGSIYGSAVGDALGAATELRSVKQIKEKFGGYVYDYKECPQDTFGRNYPVGTITDDFSMSYYVMKEIIDSNGYFSEESGKKSIINWGDDEVFFENFAGPTTRAAILNLKKGLPTDIDPFGLVNYNMKATNGGAMKSFSLGLLAKGDYDKAIEYTVNLCKPTHYNSTAIAGACAISVAVTEAIKEDTNLEKIYEAAIYGATKGRLIGEKENHISVAPDLAYKIGEAIKVGESAKDFDDLLIKISDRVGTNIQVTESVPAVFGIIAGVKGNLMEGIYAAVNAGGDTDTIATMVGAVLGAYKGVEDIPENLIDQLLKVNNSLPLEEVINKFEELVISI